jgi:hypothetical protein
MLALSLSVELMHEWHPLRQLVLNSQALQVLALSSASSSVTYITGLLEFWMFLAHA